MRAARWSLAGGWLFVAAVLLRCAVRVVRVRRELGR